MTAYAHLHWRSADGLALHARDFEDLAPSIVGATGRRVIAVDVRGRGASDRAPDPMTYNPGLYAADILALMRPDAIAALLHAAD